MREILNLALPHPSLEVIRIWYNGINGAGFTKCAFDALAAQVCTDTENGHHTVEIYSRSGNLLSFLDNGIILRSTSLLTDHHAVECDITSEDVTRTQYIYM